MKLYLFIGIILAITILNPLAIKKITGKKMEFSLLATTWIFVAISIGITFLSPAIGTIAGLTANTITFTNSRKGGK